MLGGYHEVLVRSRSFRSCGGPAAGSPSKVGFILCLSSADAEKTGSRLHTIPGPARRIGGLPCRSSSRSPKRRRAFSAKIGAEICCGHGPARCPPFSDRHKPLAGNRLESVDIDLRCGRRSNRCGNFRGYHSLHRGSAARIQPRSDPVLVKGTVGGLPFSNAGLIAFGPAKEPRMSSRCGGIFISQQDIALHIGAEFVFLFVNEDQPVFACHFFLPRARKEFSTACR